MIPTIVKLLGVTFGVFLRTYLPARRKLIEAKKNNKKFKWSHAYTKTALISGGLAFVVALASLHGLQTEVQDLIYLFSISASYGLGLNTLTNELKEWLF